MTKHFDNPFDCLAYLTSLTQGHDFNSCVFRGESDRFPRRLPSAARADSDMLQRHIVYSTTLSLFIIDQFLSPVLKKTSYGPIFGDSLLLSPDLLRRAGGEGYAQLSWRIQSLLQHYGIPTQWLDLTSSPNVAIFFASWDANQTRLLLDGSGYVYFATFSDLANNGASPLVDLCGTSDFLAGTLGMTSERSRAQSALSFRCGFHMDEIIRLSSCFQCVTFRRTPELLMFDPALYFPSEPLEATVRQWDEEYTKIGRSDPERRLLWDNHPRNKVE